MLEAISLAIFKFQWTGFGDFFKTLACEAIYSWQNSKVLYDLPSDRNAAIQCPAYVNKKRNAEFFLQGGIQTLKCASRKITRYKWTIISCGVIIGFLLYNWKFGKKRRRIALLSKGSDQSHANDKIKGIEKDIMYRLQRQLLHENIHTVEKSWNRDRDNGKQPVVVFCVISSRIGADIENAMRGVHGNSRVILVLLHSVLSGLLIGGDLSDDEELLDPSMKNRMTGVAHFAFSEREGLYDCQQNKDGFHKLLAVVISLL